MARGSRANRSRGRAGAGTRPQTWRTHAGLELDWLVRRHRGPARTQRRRGADRRRLSKAMSANDPKRTP